MTLHYEPIPPTSRGSRRLWLRVSHSGAALLMAIAVVGYSIFSLMTISGGFGEAIDVFLSSPLGWLGVVPALVILLDAVVIGVSGRLFVTPLGVLAAIGLVAVNVAMQWPYGNAVQDNLLFLLVAIAYTLISFIHLLVKLGVLTARGWTVPGRTAG